MKKNTRITSAILGSALFMGTIFGIVGCSKEDPGVTDPGVQIIPPVDGECTGWNDSTLDGWEANTAQTSVAVVDDGGEDGGFLRSTTPSGGWGIVGAFGLKSELNGDFIAKGYDRMTVSLKFSTGEFSSAVFRVRYLDFCHNGWYLPLTCDLRSTEWQSVMVEFQPDWSDEEAKSAGWVQEPMSAPFSETMAHVYHPCIRCKGAGSLTLGIDNFCLVDGGS